MITVADPAVRVLYGMCANDGAETAGSLSAWGHIHYGLGRVTRDELTAIYPELLEQTGATVEDVPDGLFWILTERADGAVSATSFPDRPAYRAAFDACEIDWARFALAS